MQCRGIPDLLVFALRRQEQFADASFGLTCDTIRRVGGGGGGERDDDSSFQTRKLDIVGRGEGSEYRTRL